MSVQGGDRKQRAGEPFLRLQPRLPGLVTIPLTHWVIPSTGPPNTCVLSGVIGKTGYNSKQKKWGFGPLGRLCSCRIKTRNNRHNEWSNCIIITRHRSYRKPSSIARGPGNCKITKPVRINIGVDPVENLISENWLKWNKVEVWKKNVSEKYSKVLEQKRTWKKCWWDPGSSSKLCCCLWTGEWHNSACISKSLTLRAVSGVDKKAARGGSRMRKATGSQYYNN